MLEMTIDNICVIPGDHHWVAILKEKDNDLYLAIFMCPGEAQVIVLKLQGVGTTRPSTHDLLGTVINTLGGSVKHVLVSDVHHSIVYTKIALQLRGEVKELDSRPSDALALAVQEGVPILAEERVLDEAAWVLDKERNLFIPLEQEKRPGPGRTSRVREGELQRLSAFTEFIDTLDLGDFGTQQPT